MSEPFAVAVQKLSLAIADVQDDLAEVWNATLGKWVGPSKFPQWAADRRRIAEEVLADWPVSMGGTGPEWVEPQ